MPTLDPSLRDQLATVIGKERAEGGARVVAEEGARAAIESLAVHLLAPYAHLDFAGKYLRNRLRARARQLGDARHADGGHEIKRLVEQAAYEHWHRMLFARFLAENELLIHPEMKVAVTLDECAELAASEGATDGWELAGRYASRMLPQIFRPDDPLLALRFALDDVRKLEDLLASLPPELFRASDSLGWCYQFWQARNRKRINDAEVRIGADELPAVTQLFTEPYMVQFLLHNTLGAWWTGAGRALPAEMPYLRRLDDGTPAAGTFEGWPRLARELKVLDPCCGSGHFLVASFEILVAFRMIEEGLSARDACDAVLRDNLFGLELDARCVQIAAFALALAAWTFPEAGGYRPLAPMNVACSGLAISAKREEWERLGGDNARLRAGMGRMWELFSDAPVLGSLIDPKKDSPNPIRVARFEDLGPMLSRAYEAMDADADAEDREVKVAAKGVASAAAILGTNFDLVCTNVPYLARHKQNSRLQQYIDTHYGLGSPDLATAFVLRCLELAAIGGSVALVTPTIWTTYTRDYEKLRRSLLAEQSWSLLGRLGKRAFTTISGEVVDVVLLHITRGTPHLNAHSIACVDAAAGQNADAKSDLLRLAPVEVLEQRKQLSNPGASIATERSATRLAEYVSVFEGLSRGDGEQFDRCYWEIDLGTSEPEKWRLLIESPPVAGLYTGRSTVFLWEGGRGRLAAHPSSRVQGLEGWGRSGVAVSRTHLNATLSGGTVHAQNCVVILPDEPSDLGAIFLYCSSQEYRDAVLALNQKLIKPTGVMDKTPIEIGKWRSLATAMFPNGLSAPGSNSPDQWYFHGLPRTADAPLQVAVARLLGFRWPEQQPDVLNAHADVDGIVCIPALRGERPAADRVAELLAAAWGRDWHPQALTDLLSAVGHRGSLEEWLRDAFFKQHCEMFHHRPFIWHVWDGHREGFSALVNYHKLNHERLKSLTYSYLGDWIRTQEVEAKAGKSGAGERLVKAKLLQQRLAAILEGEDPLDIFVRWKPIEGQPIGWHPDLDDGVRPNIRPFLTVADVGAKGAGVLRWKPNVQWGKDRGKNPAGSPWGEDRDNGIHLTLAEKRAARGET